jgi:hypothetical protein
MVSKRHCAVLVRDDQAFICDFNSTNGTFVNDERVDGERELRDGDRLKIAGLEFRIALNVASVAKRPGESVSSLSADEDAAAALLLSLDEGGAPGSVNVDSDGVPTGSTVLLPPDAEKSERAQPERVVPQSGAAARPKRARGNTAAAAQDILKSYRRPHKWGSCGELFGEWRIGLGLRPFPSSASLPFRLRPDGTSLDQKQWLVDFANAALHLIYQLPAAETWRADHFSAQLCPTHGSKCIRVILANIVLEHFDYTQTSPRVAAQVLLPANRR